MAALKCSFTVFTDGWCFWRKGKGRKLENGLIPNRLVFDILGAHKTRDLLVHLRRDPAHHCSEC